MSNTSRRFPSCIPEKTFEVDFENGFSSSNSDSTDNILVVNLSSDEQANPIKWYFNYRPDYSKEKLQPLRQEDIFRR